jgi:hypothetical protein
MALKESELVDEQLLIYVKIKLHLGDAKFQNQHELI